MKKFFLRNDEGAQGIAQAAADLMAGAHRNDVLEAAVRIVELDESNDSVGFGGYPNLHGEMQLDGAFMDGDDRAVGAVAAVKSFLPVRIARRLMDKKMHVFLTGSGAELFARECGIAEEPTLSEKQAQKWREKIDPLVASFRGQSLMDLVAKITQRNSVHFDTTVMVASDGKGLSAATSTSGWPYKFPGRVGDSPVSGAGFYVDSKFGGCLCTYTGEMAIRTGMARAVVMFMENGKSVHDAVQAAITDLSRLCTGLLRGFCIHAIDPDGHERVVAINITKPVSYQYWCEGMAAPQARPAESLNLEVPCHLA